MDLAVEIIHATVQLEQALGDGTRTVGTGFLISARGEDGPPRTVLITANHVFQKMPGVNARIGYRIANKDGSWSYSPQTLKIRDSAGQELWTQHPDRDVAVIAITAPPEFARAALPLRYLASDDTFQAFQVDAGEEMMALGFPRGLSANGAGFPILRSGRVASFPLGPARIFPTFLLDFSVFPGNSGGPVFYSRASKAGVVSIDDNGLDPGFIAGLLTQEVEPNNERLGIGVVTHAKYVLETIALLQDPKATSTIASSGEVEGAKAATAEDAARD